MLFLSKSEDAHERKAQTAGAYPGFISMKHLGVLLLPPGQDSTLFSFIFAGLKFRENFLGTFRESLISRSRRKIVFAGNLISRN